MQLQTEGGAKRAYTGTWDAIAKVFFLNQHNCFFLLIIHHN